MKAGFTRTIVTSTAKVAEITVVGGSATTKNLPDFIKINTKPLNQETALKLAKKESAYKDKNIVVLGIEVKEEVRGMSFEDFMKHSVPVVRPASQQK